jgi:hypothetical protein
MARRKLPVRHVTTDSERWRISLLAEYGFYARTIARRVWGRGNPQYAPSDAEIARIYRITKEEGVKLTAWRKGENKSARDVLTGATRVSATTRKHPKLRVA